MYEGLIEVKSYSLRGVKVEKVPGWICDISIPVHNYPNEPDDVDVEVIDQFRDGVGAVEKCLNVVRENEVKTFITDMCLAESTKESKSFNNKRKRYE